MAFKNDSEKTSAAEKTPADLRVKNTSPKNRQRRWIYAVVGVITMVGLVRYVMYTLEYRKIANMYGTIQVDMNETHVAKIFADFEIIRDQDAIDLPVGVSEMDLIPIHLRSWSEDQIRIYYAGGGGAGYVVGKQMVGSKPYSSLDFPTVLPGEKDENNDK